MKKLMGEDAEEARPEDEGGVSAGEDVEGGRRQIEFQRKFVKELVTTMIIF